MLCVRSIEVNYVCLIRNIYHQGSYGQPTTACSRSTGPPPVGLPNKESMFASLLDRPITG